MAMGRLAEALGITDVRWFYDKQVREAWKVCREAHDELTEYSDHYLETHPRHFGDETPEFDRLNSIAYDAREDFRDSRP